MTAWVLQRDLLPFNPDDYEVVWKGGEGLTSVGAQRRGCVYERMEGDVNDWLDDLEIHKHSMLHSRVILVDERAAVIPLPHHANAGAMNQFGTSNVRIGWRRTVEWLQPINLADMRAQWRRDRAAHTPRAGEG